MSEDEPATNHHATVRDLRVELCKASQSYRRLLDGMDITTSGNEYVGLVMAGSYSYILAAVLKHAQDLDEELAKALAFEIDELLADGDFDGTNDDVWPAPPLPTE